MARTDALTRAFQEPRSPTHRHFEICRAYFLDNTSATALAEQFGLHVGTVQALVRDFAANPDLEQFFVSTRPGRKTSPKREAIREQAATLRRAGHTLARIIHDQWHCRWWEFCFWVGRFWRAAPPFPRKLLVLFLEERGERDDQERGLRARWDGYEPVKRASPIWRKYGRNGQLPDKKTRTRRT